MAVNGLEITVFLKSASVLFFFRLTPLYGLLLAFYTGIFPYLKKGPFQDTQGMDSESTCVDYWYLNILYVNNIVDPLNKMVRTFSGTL